MSEIMKYYNGPVLTSMSHLLSHRRILVFGHMARLDDDTPANMALQLHINVSLNRPPDCKWLDQLRNDSTCPDWRALEACCRPWALVQRRDGPRWLCDDDGDDDDK